MPRLITSTLAALAALAIATTPSFGQGAFVTTEAEGIRFTSAQGPTSADQSPSETPVTRDEVEDYIEILRLSDEQANVIRDMYEGFRADVAEMTAEYRGRMQAAAEKAKESQDFGSLMKTIGEITDDRSQQTDQLRDTFLDDIKLLLDEDQFARWELVEQSRRRSRVLPTLNVSGAGVDLIALTRNALPDTRAEGLADDLETYARALDAHLLDLLDNRAKRSELLDEHGGLGAIEMSVSENQEELQELSEERHEIALTIRDLNDRTLRLLKAELGPDDTGTLSHAFDKAAFPEVFRTSYPERALDAALAMDNLDPSQRDQLRALREKHEAARATLNERWMRAIRAADDEGGPGLFLTGGGAVVEIRQVVGGDDQERELSRLDKARQTRQEHDSKTLDRLHETLREDQIASLPEKPKPQSGRFNLGKISGGGSAIVFEKSVTIDQEGNAKTSSDAQVITPESQKKEAEKDSSDR